MLPHTHRLTIGHAIDWRVVVNVDKTMTMHVISESLRISFQITPDEAFEMAQLLTKQAQLATQGEPV